MDPTDCKPLGDAICVRLIEEMRKLGYPPETALPAPVFEQAGFETQKDPFSGQESLCGTWRNDKGYRIGEVKFHGDGSFYAEYDLGLLHPKDSRWFVESVTAWGRGDVIKAEAKLLRALA